MSMEIHVLSDRKLASIADWQTAIDAERLGFVLSAETPIDEQHGFLPVHWNGALTGFECDHHEADQVMKLNSAINSGRNWNYGLVFYWQGFDEGLTAYLAAAAYAKATDGVVFDPQDDVVMSPQRAFEVAEQMKADIPRARAALEAMARELRGKHNST
jgi:hypothetical protein